MDSLSALRQRTAVKPDPEQVKTLPPYPDTEVRIPEGHLWVEGQPSPPQRPIHRIQRELPPGDERFHSDDSNLFGPVRTYLGSAPYASLTNDTSARSGALRPA